MPSLTELAQRLQALAQTGTAYAGEGYDRERYREISAIAANLMTVSTGDTEDPLTPIFSSERGYATPKVDVRVVVLRESTILLVQERSDGLWTLPGGWADVGDTPSASAAREVREEASLTVRISRLLGLFDRNLHGHPPHPFHIYKAVFLGEESAQGSPKGGDETSGAEFFPIDKLPPLSLDRIVPFEIETSISVCRTGAPAYFD